MTDTLVESVAKSDAEFDGRTWLGMPAAERKRYLARAEKSVAVVEAWQNEEMIREAEESGMTFRQNGREVSPREFFGL